MNSPGVGRDRQTARPRGVRKRMRWPRCSRPHPAARRQAVAGPHPRRPARRRRHAAIVIRASTGRVSGILAVSGTHDSKRPSAEAGETVALDKLDTNQDRDTRVERQDRAEAASRRRADAAVLALAVGGRPQDDVKLGQPCCGLNEEDPSLKHVHNGAPTTSCCGAGRDASAVALERLRDVSGVNVNRRRRHRLPERPIAKSITPARPAQ